MKNILKRGTGDSGGGVFYVGWWVICVLGIGDIVRWGY